MKKKLLVLLVAVFFIQCNYAQKASIIQEKRVMKTYMFSDPNPVPDMLKNYPYFKFNGFTNSSTLQEWNMVILENDYIKVYVNTDVGGKIWGAIEKSTGEEFLYFNDVVKFRDVAQRGPWTSGGVEFNYGIMGHTSTCSTPQDYVIRENEDGSVSCVIGALDLHTLTKWNVEINLQKDKAYVETKGSWFNTGNLPVPFYHYSNAAAKADGNLEFIFPGSHYIGHDGRPGDWPNENGRNIAFYENNDFGGPKSYHVFNDYSDFMGGYYHDDNFGFGNIHSYDKMPGKKLWIWGLSDEGMIWEDLLTDSNGQYIEFQTGATFNQPMEKSSLTAFKHREFIPYDSDLSTEMYFPLKNTGGMVKATKNAVLNILEKSDSKIEIRLSALAPIDAKLYVKSGENPISTSQVKLGPLELFVTEVELNAKEDFTIKLGNNLLYYSSKKEDVIVERPITPNKDFDWNSAVGYYTKGLEAEKQYSYFKSGHPRKKAQDFYFKSLALNPAYAPALNRIAYNYYRMMQYDEALRYTNKSLAVDTYDSEANYLFGIINAKLGKTANAKSGFSIASQSTSYRTAAYTELAKLNLKDNNYDIAILMADKALMYNQTNVVAMEIKAVSLRLQHKLGPVKELLMKLYNLDNTSAFVVNEKIVAGEEQKDAIESLITNELQEESYISLAMKYYDFGLIDESISVLRFSPKNAKVLLLLAYLDVPNRTEWLNKGINASPNLIFPFRGEMYEALMELMKYSDHWKLKYYASLILWKNEMPNKAKELVAQCKDHSDFAPFYLSKANLYSDDEVVVKVSLQKAKELDPDNWRVNLALTELYMKEKEYQKAALLAKKSYSINKEISILGMRYASSLLKLGKYRQSLNFLESYEIIPFEGATEGRQIYYEALINLACNAIKNKKYEQAIDYADRAKIWPKNLGAGMPYNVDERLGNSILSYCYRQLGNMEKAIEYNAKVINYKLDKDDKENSWLYLQVIALKNEGRTSEAEKLINEALEKEGPNGNFQWIEAIEQRSSSIENIIEELNIKNNKKSSDNLFLMMGKFLKLTNAVKF